MSNTIHKFTIIMLAISLMLVSFAKDSCAADWEGYESCFEKVWHEVILDNECHSKIKCPGNCEKVAKEIQAGLLSQCGQESEIITLEPYSTTSNHAVVKSGEWCADNGFIGGRAGLFPCAELERHGTVKGEQ